VSVLGKVDSMPERQPRILIADDDVDTRDILSGFLAHQGYETIVASNGEETLALAAKLPLDLALLDVVMPSPSGAELAARLKDFQPQIEVILITAYGSLEQAVEAMRQGIFYYLAKPLKLKQVLAVVEKAWAEQQAQALAEETPEMLEMLRGLTCREREVLALLAEGRTDPEIADALCISTHTASTHVRNLLDKLKVKNRVQAAVLWDRYTRARQRR
jgi:DNA-binding NarL/FixJ family response regulator